MIITSQIQMRDPFVFLYKDMYYMYGTTDKNCWIGQPDGFNAYVSYDLKSWQGPRKIFSPNIEFWGTENFWAPELHMYHDAFYLFATFKSDSNCRATSILKASSPLGPFVPWGEDSVTPTDKECLDGTLFIDDDSVPWIVYCHEWVQKGGGTICARRLKNDLSGAIGKSVILFSAKDAKWTKEIKHSSGIVGHVTDGPTMYRARNNQLWILWSSVTNTGYGLGISISKSGSILGPWKHQDKAVFFADGGHGMIFKSKTNKMLLTLHTPNNTPNERPIFLPIKEDENGFILLDKI